MLSKLENRVVILISFIYVKGKKNPNFKNYEIWIVIVFLCILVFIVALTEIKCEREAQRVFKRVFDF